MKLFIYRDDERPPAEIDYSLDYDGRFDPPLPQHFPSDARLSIMLETGERGNPSDEQAGAIREELLARVRHEVNYSFKPDSMKYMPDSVDGWYRRDGT